MPTPTPRQPQPTPLPPGGPRHSRSVTPARPDDSGGTSGTASSSRTPSQALLQQRLQGAFLTIIGLAGLIGGVLFSIEAPRFTPVPVVFLTFWLVMVIVGKILFAGLGKLREAGVGAPAPAQVRAAAAVAGIVVAVGMMGFAATTAGSGTAAAAPCPGGGPATCGPTGPELTFTPPPAQTTAPGGQQGQQGGQDQQGIATSPAGSGGDNGPGIQAQTPQFGTPGQQAPNIPGNEQPGQGNGQGGQQTGQQNPVRTTAPGRPDQSQQQTDDDQQPSSGQSSSPTVTVTKTESQCAVPGAGNGAGAPGGPGSGDSSSNGGGVGPDNGDDGDNKDGAPSWAYLVGEVSALMTGRRGRKAGPLNPDGSAPTNDMIPNDQVDGENYKEWTTPDGKRTFILSENADAPSQYRFNINEVDRPEGGSVDVNDDGTLSTYDRDGNEVDRFTPWAYDTKTGEKIPTSYTRSGDDLIQTINRPEGNNNPILADPPGDDLADSMAILQGSTVGMGPYTPEQEAIRTRAAEAKARQDLGNLLAPPALSEANPPAPIPDTAQVIEQQNQRDRVSPLTSAVTQATTPPMDPPLSTPASELEPDEPDRTVTPLITAATQPPIADPFAIVAEATSQMDIAERRAAWDATERYMYQEMFKNITSADVDFIRKSLQGPQAAQLIGLARWGQLVMPGGKWDHKTQIMDVTNRYSEQQLYFIPPGMTTEAYFDLWSNVHYGYIGTLAQIPADTLIGAQDIPVITGKQAPSDTIGVQAGIDLANSVGENLTPESFHNTMIKLVEDLVKIREGGAPMPQVRPHGQIN